MVNNIIKILVVGDHGVGKSNLLLKTVENQFVNEYIKSIGTDFKVVKGTTQSGLNYTIQIWDYVSHDHIGPFKTITNNSIVFILFLFDITNSESFSNISKWINSYNNEIKNGDNIVKILVGNKLDLKTETSIDEHTVNNTYNISTSDQETRINLFFKKYFEISVKEGANIESLFNYIIGEYEYQQQQQQNNNNNNNSNNNNSISNTDNSNSNNNKDKKKKFLFFKM